MRELKSEEDAVKLKKEKLANKEALAAKMIAEKRELNSQEVQKIRKEKLAKTELQKSRLSTEERLARVKEIKTPEPPKSPLDHVIDMAKKDALFYLEGKEISSDEAIDALKKNKSLNIKTLDSNSKQPKVYITKKPIIVDN